MNKLTDVGVNAKKLLQEFLQEFLIVLFVILSIIKRDRVSRLILRRKFVWLIQ